MLFSIDEDVTAKKLLIPTFIISGTNQCWNCESVGFYKELPAGPADFAQDGSLLAVGFGRYITLWDPDTNALKTTLPHTSSKSHVRCECLFATNRITFVGTKFKIELIDQPALKVNVFRTLNFCHFGVKIHDY